MKFDLSKGVVFAASGEALGRPTQPALGNPR